MPTKGSTWRSFCTGISCALFNRDRCYFPLNPSQMVKTHVTIAAIVFLPVCSLSDYQRRWRNSRNSDWRMGKYIAARAGDVHTVSWWQDHWLVDYKQLVPYRYSIERLLKQLLRYDILPTVGQVCSLYLFSQSDTNSRAPEKGKSWAEPPILQSCRNGDRRHGYSNLR